MARRRAAGTRKISADQKFNDVVVAKFINGLMKDGKKSVAERILYGAVDSLESKIEETAGIDVFYGALENVKPRIEVKSRRVGGSTYQIPVEVREFRKLALAIRWIIYAASTRSGKSMQEKLAAELLDAFNSKGGAVKKKEDTHKMADANKAFAHYVW